MTRRVQQIASRHDSLRHQGEGDGLAGAGVAQGVLRPALEGGDRGGLALRADRVTSRAQLVEALCAWDQELTDNGLDIAIHRLRRKLQGSGTSVRTIRGLGYLLEEAGDSPDGGAA